MVEPVIDHDEDDMEAATDLQRERWEAEDLRRECEGCWLHKDRRLVDPVFGIWVHYSSGGHGGDGHYRCLDQVFDNDWNERRGVVS